MSCGDTLHEERLALGLRFLNYINGFVGCVELITVKTPQKYMNVEVGQEALLKCTFETSEASTDDLQFVWDFAASGTANATQVPINTSILTYVGCTHIALISFKSITLA